MRVLVYDGIFDLCNWLISARSACSTDSSIIAADNALSPEIFRQMVRQVYRNAVGAGLICLNRQREGALMSLLKRGSLVTAEVRLKRSGRWSHAGAVQLMVRERGYKRNKYCE